jgi:hypothetical protein
MQRCFNSCLLFYSNYLLLVSHVNFRCIYFSLKMVVRPKLVADNLNKLVKNY